MRFAILIFSVALALAQPLRFEVASVRAVADQPPEEEFSRQGVRIDGNRVEFSLLTLFELIRRGFRVSPVLLEAPEWADGQLYDIAALMPLGSNEKQIPEMLVTLLQERFKLVIRREKREREVLALVIAKGGHKMKPAPVVLSGLRTSVDGRPQMQNTMAELAEFMAQMKNTPIIDRTGLAGPFEVDFQIGTDPEFGSGISFSLDRMGLRLEKQKATLDYIVVQKADRIPTEN